MNTPIIVTISLVVLLFFVVSSVALSELQSFKSVRLATPPIFTIEWMRLFKSTRARKLLLKTISYVRKANRIARERSLGHLTVPEKDEDDSFELQSPVSNRDAEAYIGAADYNVIGAWDVAG